MRTLAEERPCRPSELRKRWAPVEPTVVFDTYWRFAAQRQMVFMKRARGDCGPWTADPIVQTYRFTNAYRASDRVSQYLIRNVIYAGERPADETILRVLLFKLFNKIETWELLCNEFGDVSLGTFSVDAYGEVLSTAMESGLRIYSAAYIMPTGGSQLGHRRKHRNHLALLDMMMGADVPGKLQRCLRMADAFDLLKSFPTIGDFLAYQFVTDLNYTEVIDFSEMDFVVPGPGAKSGIRKCFSDLGGLTEEEVIYLMAQRQAEEFEGLGLRFEDLGGRPLQLIDCQNLFCETDKYARLAHPGIQGIGDRTRIKQKFRPNPGRIDYTYPPKWGINQKIQQQLTGEEGQA
ncbi:hypothetical protein LCGC14_0225760 [marine sediment metagenome]|uniref:5-hmdU DNA kinase helical domain-containing protein n=1 Tax=marine sediment metagenome TaxID=412755 RepID=A0A0F9XFN7_9ZZZZ|nr:hypothetical protein [Phycisphaerae bacterium]HDZ42970.1 hypothetical protein [Phycisphaerae bacterium]